MELWLENVSIAGSISGSRAVSAAQKKRERAMSKEVVYVIKTRSSIFILNLKAKATEKKQQPKKINERIEHEFAYIFSLCIELGKQLDG